MRKDIECNEPIIDHLSILLVSRLLHKLGKNRKSMEVVVSQGYGNRHDPPHRLVRGDDDLQRIGVRRKQQPQPRVDSFQEVRPVS